MGETQINYGGRFWQPTPRKVFIDVGKIHVTDDRECPRNTMGVPTEHRGCAFCKVLKSMNIAEMPAVEIGIVTPHSNFELYTYF